jgi:hypothetical protein
LYRTYPSPEDGSQIAKEVLEEFETVASDLGKGLKQASRVHASAKDVHDRGELMGKHLPLLNDLEESLKAVVPF